MDYSVPINLKLRSELPLPGCNCLICDSARVEVARPKFNPFRQAVSEMFDTLKAAPLPFDPEPAEAEPVYTHVLLDYDDDDPNVDCVELHTTESVLEAIALRKDQAERFQVYRLGECILDVSGP